MHEHFQLHPVEAGGAIGGSATAVGGGLWAALNANSEVAAIAGLILSAAGLITALGSVVVPILRLWFSEREFQNKAREARHDTANKLQLAEYKIRDLQDQMEQMAGIARTQQGWITEFVRQNPGSVPDAPTNLLPSESP